MGEIISYVGMNRVVVFLPKMLSLIIRGFMNHRRGFV